MHPVLIVGAGPVGLTAALNLAHFNVPVRIIDVNPAPTTLSKALVIWRRSLQTLDPLFPHDKWGMPVGGLNMADSGAIFATMNAGCGTSAATTPAAHMLPPGRLITQAQVERTLAEALQQKYGIKVQRSTRLESFSVVDEAGGLVRCVMSTSSAPTAPAAGGEPAGAAAATDNHHQQQEEGDQEAVLVSYLIGCDGARSAVRKALGVAFNGFSDPHNRFLMMDCTYEVEQGINSHKAQQDAEAQPQADMPMMSTTATGLTLTIPLADTPDAVRLVWNVGRDGPAEPTLDDFQSQLLQHTRLQIRLKDVLWQSAFSVNERQVDSYVHHGGRVLLAGDAAHVHTPAGGQGMNTGIQDAANLAWKVALAAAGGVASGPQLLQTYQEERYPIGEQVIKLSGTMLRANAIRSPVLRLLRRAVLSVVTRLPGVQQRFMSTIAEDTVSYTSSSLAKAPGGGGSSSSSTGPAAARCAGTAFPDASISINGVMSPATDLLRTSKGSFGSLVLLTPPTSASSDGGGGGGEQVAAAADSQSNGTPANTTTGSTGWPTHWGHWPLHVVRVAHQGLSGAAGGGAGGDSEATVSGAWDKWGLLAAYVGGADGVLVRPDGIIAVAGGAQQVTAWLDSHGFKHS